MRLSVCVFVSVAVDLIFSPALSSIIRLDRIPLQNSNKRNRVSIAIVDSGNNNNNNNGPV